MHRVLMAGLTASMLAAGCGTAASDSADALEPGASRTTVTTTTTTTTGAARPRSTAVAASAGVRSAPAREVTIPSGTMLALSLTTAVGSETSNVEDTVGAELTRDVIVNGRTALRAGATAAGVVTAVDDSGRVKGRARVEINFTSITSGGRRYAMSTDPYARLAPATKGEDATKIGIGAGAGALIGGLLGGKKGAAQGTAVGGGAGAGVVLATRGKQVLIERGADVSTSLTSPLTVRLAN